MAISKLCLLLLLGIGVVYNTVTSNPCRPFKALFIFDRYQFEQSFDQLRRFMITYVEKLPDETLINVITIGDNKIDKFKFTKMAGNESWTNEIGHLSETSQTIKHTTISDAIFDFFDEKENPRMAEQIYLLVNEKTVIDDTLKAKKALEKKKRHIVLYGKHTKGDIWTDLSMDEKHIEILEEKGEVIDATVERVKYLSCFDSQYVCDIDEYWKDDQQNPECSRCSYICCDTKSTSPEICDKKCPYYFSLKSIQAGKEKRHSCSKDQTTVIVLSVSFAISVVITTVIVCVWKKIPNKLKKWWNERNSNRNNEEGIANANAIVDKKPEQVSFEKPGVEDTDYGQKGGEDTKQGQGEGEDRKNGDIPYHTNGNRGDDEIGVPSSRLQEPNYCKREETNPLLTDKTQQKEESTD